VHHRSLTNGGDVATRLLTEDHNGSNSKEAARIMSQYSHVSRCAGLGHKRRRQHRAGACRGRASGTHKLLPFLARPQTTLLRPSVLA
jgi:hypothetical protein